MLLNTIHEIYQLKFSELIVRGMMFSRWKTQGGIDGNNPAPD